MNSHKRLGRQKVFLLLWMGFTILTLFGAGLCIFDKVSSPGYAIVPMCFTQVFASLYRIGKKTDSEE